MECDERRRGFRMECDAADVMRGSMGSQNVMRGDGDLEWNVMQLM